MADATDPGELLYNPLSENFLDVSFLGPSGAVYHARSGDLRYPACYDKYDTMLLSQIGLTPLKVPGDKKIVSIQEFYTQRRAMIDENRKYFKNVPPAINLDYEDPLRDMVRIVYGVAREVILKGARFLVGKGRFDGLNSLDLENVPQTFRTQLETTWNENDVIQMMKQTTRTYLWAGDDFWKMAVQNQIQITIDEVPQDSNSPLTTKEKVVDTKVKFTRCSPEHFHAVLDPYDGNEVLAWVYQFEKPDKSFYREEIFRDMTLVYDGYHKRLQTDAPNQVTDVLKSIPNTGFAKANMYTVSDGIEYTLRQVVPHGDLDDFPLIVWRNDPEYGPYGNTEFLGLHGKFDALNGMVTRTLFAIDQLADPVMVMSGTNFNPHNQVKAADNLWVLPEKDAKLNVVQWDGNIDGVLKMIDLIATQVYRTVGVPKSSEMKAFTNVSGDALNIINTDIVDATNDRRLDLEAGIKRMIKLIRKAYRIKSPYEDSVAVIWGPVFPESAKDKNSRLITLARERIVKRYRVVQLDPTVPPHLKEDMIDEANELEDTDQRMKEQAIAAQTAPTPSSAPASGGTKKAGQSKRFTQRAAGITPERGDSTKPEGE